MMKSSCYCCCQANPSKMMDIDSALNELGMLSSVTESRRQFLRERNRTKSEGSVHISSSSPNLSASGFQILQIDTNYVTGFSSVSPPVASPISFPTSSLSSFSRQSSGEKYDSRRFSSGYRDVEEGLEAEARKNRLARIKYARARRFCKPYNVPGRLYHSMQESVDYMPEEAFDSRHSKSNATSPSKPNSASLPRSRSLDNLENAKLKLVELFESEPSPEQKIALEEVSRNMENLHVNE